MQTYNLNNKSFKLLSNSENGIVESETIFKYKQSNELVTAEYKGGSIIYGKIIAQLEQNILHMLYNCYTTEKELKAGKATAILSLNENGKMKLMLDWQWFESEEIGSSTYIEI